MRQSQESGKSYILVIDDDPLLTRTLKKVLEREGYFVDTAQNGYEGIQKAKSGFFHLILCDIRMPGLDGLMTIRHIQEFQQKAGSEKSGFIVITAYDAEDSRKRAFQLGVTDFLFKPFDLPKFLEAVAHHAPPVPKQSPEQELTHFNERLERLLSSVHATHSPSKPS